MSKAKLKPQAPTEPPPAKRLESSHSGEITIKWIGGNLLATSPTGREVVLEPDYRGYKTLLELAKWATREREALRPSEALAMAPGLSPTQLATLFSPQDYTRVCHCGTPVTPFMERCEGCPGALGAGKIVRYDEKGKPTVSLAELGFDL